MNSKNFHKYKLTCDLENVLKFKMTSGIPKMYYFGSIAWAVLPLVGTAATSAWAKSSIALGPIDDSSMVVQR
jgi:hypothetical protein